MSAIFTIKKVRESENGFREFFYCIAQPHHEYINRAESAFVYVRKLVLRTNGTEQKPWMPSKNSRICDNEAI